MLSLKTTVRLVSMTWLLTHTYRAGATYSSFNYHKQLSQAELEAIVLACKHCKAWDAVAN